MCGIVAYFGAAPNSLTRVIAGMSAIVYRAPDSTGIGSFGSLSSGVRILKTTGSVSRVVELLARSPLDRAHERQMMDLWISDDLSRTEMQRRLLEFEGLDLDILEQCIRRERAYPSSRDLMAPGRPVFIRPGFPGSPEPEKVFTFSSAAEIREVVQGLLRDHDLSFVAIKALFRLALSEVVEDEGCPFSPYGDNSDPNGVAKADIYHAFDHFFARIFREYRPVRISRGSARRPLFSPGAKKGLMKCLFRAKIILPRDFDTDGIACLMRILERAVAARIPHDSGIEDGLQNQLQCSFLRDGIKASCDWRSLFLAEKGLNIFGRAASSVLAWARQASFPTGRLPIQSPESPDRVRLKPGSACTPWLDYLAQPVIGHGRWALQSAVTRENAHPFTDEKQQRCMVLNGQFDADVEEQLAEYLTQVARLRFRSGNSSEFFPLLWGYYYEVLTRQRDRFQQVMDLTRTGLEAYSVGSSTLSYRRLKQVEGKSDRSLDEYAFIEAARRFTQKGGQIAVAGISLKSPGTLYVAACNRPVFIVRKPGSSEYMVVSDINAALGLFPQSRIQEVTGKYEQLIRLRDRHLYDSKAKGESDAGIEADFEQKIDQVLKGFQVEVFPLEGGQIFARIVTMMKDGRPVRRLTVSSFDGVPLHEIGPELVCLTPPHIHKVSDKSFFESHLMEVPDLLAGILRNTAPKPMGFPKFGLDFAMLKSRFGRDLKSLKRIFLMGMGSSYHVCLMAEELVRSLLPGIEVACQTPMEADLAGNGFSSDCDLVLMISWSGTTAEMVKLAHGLLEKNILFAGLTEKVFADMGILARKSLGSVHAGSGEEVCIPAVKSTFCSLMTLDLIMVWLAGRMTGDGETPGLWTRIWQVPEMVRQVLGDDQLDGCCREQAHAFSGTGTLFIFDALDTTGLGHEAALKLREMTWSLNVLALDYSPEALQIMDRFRHPKQAMVTATCRRDAGKALEVVRHCHEHRIPVFVLATASRDIDKIRRYSGGRFLLVPDLDGPFQPFIDLVFIYFLAFYTAAAMGRRADDYPRNRVKSVTTTRSSQPSRPGFKEEQYQILEKEKQLSRSSFGSVENHPDTWETYTGFNGRARAFAGAMVRLGNTLMADRPLARFLEFDQSQVHRLSGSLFTDRHAKEVMVACLDSSALAAARDAADHLNRLLPCRIRVLAPGRPCPEAQPDNPLICLAAKPVTETGLKERGMPKTGERFWIGPLPRKGKKAAGSGLFYGKGVLEKPVMGQVAYAALTLLLLEAFRQIAPEEARGLIRHFQRAGQAVAALASDTACAEAIARIPGENPGYRSMLYLSPFRGMGVHGAATISAGGNWLAQPLVFGEGAHGLLAAVDNRVNAKYRQVGNRGNHRADQGRYKPFFAGDGWYLPRLRPGYDSAEDTLVLLDASCQRFLDLAGDELAVFGCRHARIIAITQSAFLSQGRGKMFSRFPLAGVIALPPLKANRGPTALSDFHLPFVSSLVAACIAGTVLAGQENSMPDEGGKK